VEKRLERLYRRLGRKYALLFVGWIALVAIVTGGISVSAAVPYLHASRREVLEIFVSWQVQTNLALVIIVLIARRLFRNALVWGRGERSPMVAARAWVELVVNVPRLCFIGTLLFVAFGLPAEINGALVLDLPWYSVPIMFIGAGFVIVTAAMLDYFGVEQLCRPILREVAAKLPSDFDPPRPFLPLRLKIFGAITTVSFVAAVIGAEAGTADLSPVGRMTVGVGAALLVTGTLSMVMTVFLDRSLVTPIHELIAATKRVEGGDLGRVVPLLGADEVGSLARSFNRMMGGLEEREALRLAMGVYVDPEVAQRVLTEGQLLRGQEFDVTVMFLDIRDFTSFAEQHSPQETVSHLNDFFGLIVPLLAKRGGQANKFLGDGLLAVFGAPVRHVDHADRAVAAAQEITSVLDEAYAGEMRVGIGMNSGPVVVGSVGGGGRLEFTLIGDAVNVAARVEQLTKDTGDVILLTEATRVLLSDGNVVPEQRGRVRIRGKSQEVAIHALPTKALSPSPAPLPLAGS
jgi:class 3 adenylate cyclase